MHYSPDATDPSKFWIDRNEEGDLDHFEPCDSCHTRAIEEAKSEEWNPLTLCVPCRSDLALTSWLFNELRIPKPVRFNPLPISDAPGKLVENKYESFLW